MTKLKTLQDLECYAGNPNMTSHTVCVSIEDLKQEAIKWVKYYEKIRVGEYDEAILFFKGKFMDFFNLTEEEIKK